MSSSPPATDDFNHQLAIKLSRALNIVNPNDLLAQRVTDIAKNNSLDGFIKGTFSSGVSTSLAHRLKAASSFGKFKDSFLDQLYSEIMTHVKQEETGIAPRPVVGITVHDSDVLQPETMRQGGLVRQDTVRFFFVYTQRWVSPRYFSNTRSRNPR